MPVVLPHPTITVIPVEGTSSPTDEFPSLASITFRDRVGGVAANRQPNELRQRDLTLRDRVNRLIADMNVLATGVGGSLAFIPRDGSLPLAGNLDFATTYLPINLPAPVAAGHATNKTYVDTLIAALTAQITAITSGTASLLRSGTLPMLGNLDFGNFRGINAVNPINPTDLVNLQTMQAALAPFGNGVLTQFNVGAATGFTTGIVNNGGGSYTWAVPKTGILVMLVVSGGGGGGGGGGGDDSTNDGGGAGGGGQGGGYALVFVPVIAGQTIAIQVGSGGTAGASGGNSATGGTGGTGGTSTVTINGVPYAVLGGIGGTGGIGADTVGGHGPGGIGGNGPAGAFSAAGTAGGNGGRGGGDGGTVECTAGDGGSPAVGFVATPGIGGLRGANTAPEIYRTGGGGGGGGVAPITGTALLGVTLKSIGGNGGNGGPNVGNATAGTAGAVGGGGGGGGGGEENNSFVAAAGAVGGAGTIVLGFF